MIPLFPDLRREEGGVGISFDAVNGISLPAVALPSETAGVEEAGVPVFGVVAATDVPGIVCVVLP